MEGFQRLMGVGVGARGSLASNGDFDIATGLRHEFALFGTARADEQADEVVPRVFVDGDHEFFGR